MHFSVAERKVRVERRAARDTYAAENDLIDLRSVRKRLQGKRDQAHEEVHHARRDGAVQAHFLDPPETPPLCIGLGRLLFLGCIV